MKETCNLGALRECPRQKMKQRDSNFTREGCEGHLTRGQGICLEWIIMSLSQRTSSNQRACDARMCSLLITLLLTRCLWPWKGALDLSRVMFHSHTFLFYLLFKGVYANELDLITQGLCFNEFIVCSSIISTYVYNCKLEYSYLL